MDRSQQPPYLTLASNSRAPRGGDGASTSSASSTYGSGSGGAATPSATHDISRVSYHVKQLDTFAKTLEDSASRAFPNRGRPMQRYCKVHALLLHWGSDDLFVLPELEDLERCMRDNYNFETDIFPIPSENSHLELMLKIGAMIKEHESTDTLFIVYYGGHARIDESRQSTWCATRHSGSPWLQWSAIQTLLERSVSDVLILLDCCAGAASATFPNGQSITETISASSWDAIAPDPGRYSFTNALIEVMHEWRQRLFSAAMLHAEVLARLKHPRPVTINGKHFEARSTPVHFMMTSNHRAPSIELGRIYQGSRRPSGFQDEASSAAAPAGTATAPQTLPHLAAGHSLPPSSSLPSPHMPLPVMAGGRGQVDEVGTEPNEDRPHVMISLALEDNQQLDLNAWEQWLASFPALAKYVKVQGVFRSHSTLLLLSLPVMIWDLLPEDPACSFVAFIRSNNLIKRAEDPSEPLEQAATSGVPDQVEEMEDAGGDGASIMTGTTYSPAAEDSQSIARLSYTPSQPSTVGRDLHSPGGVVSEATHSTARHNVRTSGPGWTPQPRQPPQYPQRRISNTPTFSSPSASSLPLSSPSHHHQAAGNTVVARPSSDRHPSSNPHTSRQSNPVRDEDDIPVGPLLAAHVVTRLEEYFQKDPEPNSNTVKILASNLGIDTRDVHLWLHRRHRQERMTYNLQSLQINDQPREVQSAGLFGSGSDSGRGVNSSGPRMILPGHLNRLLEIFPTEVLLVDLRSVADFEKSHIHRASNLRAPVEFVRHSTLEMVESAFVDEESRREFAAWSTSRCVVFYDRVVEFTWECPTAAALLDKFRRNGWDGKCFVLKGHYREFSASYDRYIVGKNMSQNARDFVEATQQVAPVNAAEALQTQQEYQDWLSLVENEDRVPSTNLIPAKKRERLQAIEENQRDLEAEFRARFPSLYKRFLGMQPPPPPPSEWPAGKHSKGDKFGATQGVLVEPLVRGLEKMHEAGLAHAHRHSHSPPPPPPPMSGPPTLAGKAAAAAASDTSGGGGGYVDKLAGETASTEGFDEIDPRDEQLRNDPAFQSAGEGAFGGTGGRGVGAYADAQRKRALQSLWDRIRR